MERDIRSRAGVVISHYEGLLRGIKFQRDLDIQYGLIPAPQTATERVLEEAVNLLKEFSSDEYIIQPCKKSKPPNNT